MEISFLYFIQSGKTHHIPGDCDKSYVYIVIPRATIKKTIQSDIVKNTK